MGDTDRFMAVLRDDAVPMCDDCIALAVGWARRQSAHAAGRTLADGRAIHRAKGTCGRCGRMKTVSRLGDIQRYPATEPVSPSEKNGRRADMDRPWHWEGNIQSVLVRYLVAQGYQLHQVVDTASKESGVDIIAERGSEMLWVTVKGYPAGTARTNASTQGRHWFSHAMFDVVRYRTERPDITIGVGLPDGFPSYLNLAPKVWWLKQSAPFRFFWVAEDGSVREE